MFAFLDRLLRRLFFIRPKTKGRFPFKWRNPDYEVIFNIKNSVEEFRLMHWGGEKEYVMEMTDELSDNDIFFDIGSSVGLNSILAAKKLKQGKVVSFEPDPENVSSLVGNYRVNHLSNYTIKPIAVGDQKTIMKLYTKGSNGYSPSLRKVNGIENFIEVKVDTIDDLIERKEIPYPTVIKIDIEGAELMALKGMKKLLSSPKRPRLVFLEIHPEYLKSFNASVEDVLGFLSTLEYTKIKEAVTHNQVLCKLVRK